SVSPSPSLIFTLSLHDALPIYVPVFTGVPLESRLVIELAKHPNIRGMKDSSGDVRLISETVWNTDAARFSVVAGTGATLFHTMRSEEHTSELQSRFDLVCRLLL